MDTGLTEVHYLASARLAALCRPTGAYDVADTEPHPRDAAASAVLVEVGGKPVRLRHVPETLARVVTGLLGRGDRPLLTRHAIDQVAAEITLDLTQAPGDRVGTALHDGRLAP